MSVAEEVGTGELVRGLDAVRGEMKDLRTDFKELLKEIRDRPDKEDLRAVEAGLRRDLEAETTARLAAQDVSNKAIKALEDGNTWIIRTVGASLVTALAAAIGVVSNISRIGG